MSYNIIGPSQKKKVALSEKIAPSEEVEKVTKTLDDIEEPVVTICRKCLDNFQGKYTRSTRWFNIDRDWLNETFSTLEMELLYITFQNKY